MTISPNGEVQWKVPADYADDRAGVIITVRDSAGQETMHSFNITVK